MTLDPSTGDVELRQRDAGAGPSGFALDSADELIELVGVSRVYVAGLVHAVNDVSLAVHRGEFLAIAGPSGSGKTTLLNLMSGLDRPTTGSVRFDGVEPAGPRDWARLRAAKVGFVFQAFHLLPALSALENVQVPMFGTARPSSERASRALDLLQQVGLSSKIARRPDELSAGEQQRVAIARSLANGPGVLLADEPTGNLDTRNAAAILELLIDLRRTQGLAMVVVTHNPDVARRADRAVDIVDGRIAGPGARSMG